ncbi:MAG: hypothetical protein K6E51_03650 [Treponema sp.]|nr:hypothetical protein [Treponema sp.]
MKKTIFIVLILLLQNTLAIFAQVPDMEYFLPTEYQFMTELHQNDAQDFIQNKPDFLKKCEYTNTRVLDGREYPEQKIVYDRARVFFENVNNEKYIWVLLPITRNEYDAEWQKRNDWIPEYKYIIALFRGDESQSELLFIAPTYYFGVVFYTVNTFQIVKGKDKNKGIIHYRNVLRFSIRSDNVIEGRKTKGQSEGTVLAYYYLLDEQSKSVEFEKEDAHPDFIYRPINWNTFPINASAFLWDLKKPLKYALQNAFDQNPATSFVENTEDDLITIEIPIANAKNGKPFEKLAVINGYAANKDLYSANNSIKEIGMYAFKPVVVDGENFVDLSKKQTVLCAGNNFGYQVFALSDTFYTVKVDSFYKGTKYNDTCLAELNFFYNGEWLFGNVE